MVPKIHPDWLPTDWKLQMKVKNGRKLKCYVHTKTSQKVYSRLAVLRCINNESVASDHSDVAEKRAKKDSSKQETQPVVTDDLLKGLPTGWTVETKIRHSGSREGTAYKCFTDPSSGSKFYSKPEVYRYLQSIQNSAGPSGLEERRGTRHSASNNSVGPSRREERRHTRHSSSNRPVDQLKALESNVEPNVSAQNQETTASRRLSLRNKERPVDPLMDLESNVKPNVSTPNQQTTASRRLSLRKRESPVDQLKSLDSNVEPNMSTQNQQTTASRRLSLRKRERPADQLKALESNVEPNVSTQSQETTASRKLSLRKRERPVDQLKALESNVEPNVSTQNQETTANRKLSLRNKERPVDPLKDLESNVEPNVSTSNPKTTASTRSSLRIKEPNVSESSDATASKRQSSRKKELNMSENSKMTASTRLSSREKEPNEPQNSKTIPEPRNSKTTPSIRLSSRKKEPNVSLDSETTPSKRLTSEKKEPNVSENSKTTPSGRLSSENKKVVVVNTVDKDLPSGWIKEMRKRLRGNQVVRTDPFYVHPASGLVFRSKLEVLRYLETGEISRHAYWRRKHVDIEELAIEKNSLTPLVKRVARANCNTREEFLAGEKTPKGSPSPMPEAGVPKEAAFRRITRSSSSVRPASTGEVKPDQSSLSPEVQDDKAEPKKSSLFEIEQPSTSAVNISTLETTVAVSIKGCSNKKAQSTKRKSKDQNLLYFPSRSSKRLAGVDVQPVFHSTPIEHALRATNKKSIKAKPIPSLSDVPDDLQGKPKPPDADTQNVPISQQPQHCALDVSAVTVLVTEEPLKNSDSLMGSAPPAFSEVVAVDAPLINTEQPSESLMDHPVMDEKPDALQGSKIERSMPGGPVAEEQPGSIARDTEQSGSEFKFPPPLWSDPCLEFAYKTLTGAIPLDDNLAIEDYIQYQLHTSKQSNDFQSLPDIDMSSFPQNDATKPVPPLPEGTKLPNGNSNGPQQTEQVMSK
ncbi:hypothetical protein vseg_020242 [Gypsophila vaccaria]